MPSSIPSFVSAAWACAALAASLPVAAQDKAGLYVSVLAGTSSLASTHVTESRPGAATLSGPARLGNGTGWGGAIGQRYGNGWAAELAWDYRSHPIERIAGTSVSGDFASTVAFLNGYYRFQKMGPVRPFVGLGLGYVTEMDIDISRDGTGQEFSRRGGLATQAIVGGEIDLTERWSVSADLRWSRMGSGAFKATQAGAALGGEPKYQPTSLNVGLAFRF